MFELPPPRAKAIRVSGPSGCADIDTAAGRRIGLVLMYGSQESSFLDVILPALQSVLVRDGGLHFFADTLGLTDYETAYRERFTKWILERRGKMQGAHVLVKSPLVVMGITLANIPLKGFISSYRDRATFEQKMKDLAAEK